MKSTGVVRRIDDLGRIVIPKEIRRSLRIREGDSLEQIISKYQITREELEKYNDLKELSIGDKIIIPYLYENNK